MIRIVATAAVVCIVGAAALLATRNDEHDAVRPGAGAGAVPEPAAVPEPGAVPKPLHAEAARIAPTSLADLAARAAVLVTVPSGGHVSGRLVDPSGSPSQPLGPATRAPRGDRGARLRVTPAAARLAAGCSTRWLVVDVRDADGKLAARSRKLLRRVAPACARFFRAGAVWNRALPASAPVDAHSADFVRRLVAQVERNFHDKFYPNINTTRFSVPVYVVPAGQPRVPIRLTGGAVRWGQGLQRVLDKGVPIPDRARPAAGSGTSRDSHIVIYQPATDTMWEFWTARRVGRGWRAGWGGVMHGVSRSPGWFQPVEGVQTGATATSLPLVGGLITLRDLRRGEIDHALAIAIPVSRSGVWTKPAQRSDGNDRSPDAIPAGAHFRLDPELDLDALHLPRVTAMLARAAQRYGIFVRDTSPAVTFYAQDPTPTGSDPWRAALRSPGVPQIMRAFPWERLQVMRTDLWTYGKRIKP